MTDPVIPFDQLPRFIRVRSEPDARFVEFDFAIGHPELFVELVMPYAAFATFCKRQRVVQMDAAMCQAVDEDAAKWRYGDIGRREAHGRE
jgi:phenol hydroxylase P0 protein